MKYELQDHSFGQTLGKTFNIYLENFLPLVLIALVVQTPSIYIQYMELSSPTQNTTLLYKVIGNLSTIIAGSILSAFAILYLSKKLLGENVTIASTLSHMMAYLLPVLGLLLLIGLMAVITPLLLFLLIFISGGGITSSKTIIMVVLFLSLIPGIYLILGYYVAVPILVLEKQGMISSLKRSWYLTDKFKLQIFALLFVMSILQIIIIAPLTAAVSSLFNPSTDSLIYSVILYFISAIISPLSSCLTILVYYNLKVRKEGFNIEHLSSHFDEANQWEE